MIALEAALREHCSNLDSAVIDRHLRRMPGGYFERYAMTEVAEHLRMLSEVSATEPLALEVRSLGTTVYEILVTCINYAGTIACITTALAADQFNLEDLQITNSHETDDDADEPDYSVIVLRVSGPEDDTPEELSLRLNERLGAAFVHLAAGHFHEAQAAAARPDVGQTAPSVRAQVGLLLGDYRLEKRLARGGMSEVYLATQISLDRTVAVKVARQEGGPDDESAARFTREALVLAQFQSPYIVPVLGTGTVPSGNGVLAWIAMEYEAGGDLARHIATHGPAPVELALRWFRQALEGLRYAHHNGILHRDIKPHNLLLTAESNVKLGDFGLFKFVAPEELAGGLRRPVRGTPYYMSPEQARGEHLDERSDVFSLGSTFFHVLTGRMLFEGTNPADVLHQLSQSDPPRLLDFAPELPLPLGVVFNRMLARKREERYQDVGVLLADLESYVVRELLPVAESGSFPAATSADVTGDSTTIGQETAAYVPAVESDPLIGSN